LKQQHKVRANFPSMTHVLHPHRAKRQCVKPIRRSFAVRLIGTGMGPSFACPLTVVSYLFSFRPCQNNMANFIVLFFLLLFSLLLARRSLDHSYKLPLLVPSFADENSFGPAHCTDRRTRLETNFHSGLDSFVWLETSIAHSLAACQISPSIGLCKCESR